MDLGTIRKGIQSGKYTTPEEVYSLVELTVSVLERGESEGSPNLPRTARGEGKEVGGKGSGRSSPFPRFLFSFLSSHLVLKHSAVV